MPMADLPREEGSPWVIRGRLPGSHITDLQRPWRRIRARAGLEDVRIHDLRHSCAAYIPNPPHLLTLFHQYKFRNQIVTGFDHIPVVACRIRPAESACERGNRSDPGGSFG